MSKAKSSRRTKVALLSCGLGNVNRGYEVAASRWYEALKTNDKLHARLFCGGRYPGGHKTFNLPRGSKMAALLRKVGVIKDGARLEQLSFGLGLLPYLLRWRPDVIWLQEYSLARKLTKWRRLPGFNYRIVFCNGAPVGPNEYQYFDFVQHLHSSSYQDAIDFGLDAAFMTILPYCCPAPKTSETSDRQTTRERYHLAEDDWIVLCVAAWNSHHKRIDYLIDEVAALNEKKVKLLLCGYPETETDELKKLGKEKLGKDVIWLTLPSEKIPEVMSIADVFVLPSLSEGLANVLIEAAFSGVTIVSHTHVGGQFIFNENPEMLCDLSKKGNLTHRLQHLKNNPISPKVTRAMKEAALKRFSCSTLAPQFADMIDLAQKANPK